MPTPQNIQRYHITIKDLVSWETQGFMLNPWKDGSSMFKYNTLAPIVAKNQSWEITMGDLTNTSVFVQFSWSGQTSATGQPFGPRGIKYWTPRYLYSAMLPTQMYWYGQGTDTTSQDWEIHVAKAVTAGTLLPNGEKISCRALDNNTNTKTYLYAGSADSATIFKSDDNGNTWTTLIDIDTALWTSHWQIRQLLLIKDKKTKKLCILCGQVWTGQYVHLYTYSLSNYYWLDLLKHEAGNFYDSETNEESRYPNSPDLLTLVTIPQSTISYNSIADSLTVKSPIKIHDIADQNNLLITWLSDEDVKVLRNMSNVALRKKGSSSVSPVRINFLNDTLTPLQYRFSDTDLWISVPSNSMIVDYTSITWDKSYTLVCYNKIETADASDCRVGMVINAGGDDMRIYKISWDDIYVDHIVYSSLPWSGTFTFTAESYQRVFDVTTSKTKSLLGAKYKKGSTIFSILDESSWGKNECTLLYKNNHMYSVPEKFTTDITTIVADRDIWATSGTATIEHLQSCGSSQLYTEDLHHIIQIMKLGYDETITDPEEYIGAIVYYAWDKYQYQFTTLQLHSIKDQRLWHEETKWIGYIRHYQDYYDTYSNTYPNVSYGCKKQSTTQGFDEDIPTTMASLYDVWQWSIPISIGYDEVGNTSYFSTFKRIWGDTITIWKANKTGVEKVTETPGVGYATWVQFSNNKVFFCSKNYGRVYTFMTTNSYGNTVTQTKYEVINMQRVDPSDWTFTEQEQSNLLTGVVYEWDYVCVSDVDWNVYAYDTLSWDFPFTEKTNIEEIAIAGNNTISVTALIPLGDRLLIQTDNDTIWNLDQSNNIRDKAYLCSSSYGAYLGTVNKNWIQAKVILNNQILIWDKGQKFRYAVSFDNWQTFFNLPKILGLPFIADDFYNTTTFDSDYEYEYGDLLGDDKNEMRFRFPYYAISKRIVYKIEIYSGQLTDTDEIKIAHIENQYLLQSFKELLLQLDIYLRPKVKLLDGSYEHEPNAHRNKITFLQTIWQDQRKCEIKMPRGDKYYGIPFAIPGTGNDGFSLSSIDIEPGKKDLDRATYSIQMSFKTIIQL